MHELYDQLPRLPRDHPLAATTASVSPLLLAQYRTAFQVKPYPHMQYLDRHLLALANLELYPDGPGPPPEVYGRQYEGEGPFQRLGKGFNAAISEEAHAQAELLFLRPGHAPGTPGTEPGGVHRVVTRLAIALPPRHGKSTLVTEHLPIWFLLRHPKSSVVVSTYSQDFADTWGKGQRALLTENESSHWNRLPLASDGLPLEPYDGTQSDISFRPGKDIGEIHYRGFRGSLTGIGWNLGIIDDPFKDWEDAHSPAVRKQKHEWYSAVFRSRVTRRPFAPPPLEIMMFTRWHEDDIAGKYAYQEDGETPAPGWYVLRLPALSEDPETDPLHRPKEASLCPQLMSKDHLLQERTQDPANFACLYQGSPTAAEGSLFHTPFRHYTQDADNFYSGTQTIPKDAPLYFVTADLAASLKTSADYTVFSLWAFDQTTLTLILVDALRERISTENHASTLHRFIARNALTPPEFIGIEDKSFGTNLINEIRNRPEFHKYPIIPLKADKDKYTRAVPYAEASNAGKVWFPEPEDFPLGQTWENEHARFPNRTKHDDMVDTGAYAYAKARDYMFTPQVREPYKRPSDEERAWKQLEERDRKAKRGGFQSVLNGQL